MSNVINMLKGELFWLINEAEGCMGLKSNWMEADSSKTGVDYVHLHNVQIRSIGSASKFKRLSDILFSLSKHDQHVLVAWVASQPPDIHIRSFFGENAWIAVYTFKKQEEVLAKICKDYFYNRNSIQLKRIINKIKIDAQANLDHAVSSWIVEMQNV